MRVFSFKQNVYFLLLLAGLILFAGVCCPATALAQSSKSALETKSTIAPSANANSSALAPSNSNATNEALHSSNSSKGTNSAQGNLYPVTGGNASRLNATTLNATSMGEADAYFQKEGKDAAFSWSGYFMAIGALLLVLGLLWLVVWALRKRGALPGMALLGRNSFKVEASLSLGPKKNLVLVRFLNSRFLLGVTDHQITLIKEVEGQDAHGKPNTDNTSDFSELLRQASQKNDKPGSN